MSLERVKNFPELPPSNDKLDIFHEGFVPQIEIKNLKKNNSNWQIKSINYFTLELLTGITTDRKIDLFEFVCMKISPFCLLVKFFALERVVHKW